MLNQKKYRCDELPKSMSANLLPTAHSCFIFAGMGFCFVPLLTKKAV